MWVADTKTLNCLRGVFGHSIGQHAVKCHKRLLNLAALEEGPVITPLDLIGIPIRPASGGFWTFYTLMIKEPEKNPGRAASVLVHVIEICILRVQQARVIHLDWSIG